MDIDITRILFHFQRQSNGLTTQTRIAMRKTRIGFFEFPGKKRANRKTPCQVATSFYGKRSKNKVFFPYCCHIFFLPGALDFSSFPPLALLLSSFPRRTFHTLCMCIGPFISDSLKFLFLSKAFSCLLYFRDDLLLPLFHFKRRSYLSSNTTTENFILNI